jgi:hypothetical protein
VSFSWARAKDCNTHNDMVRKTLNFRLYALQGRLEDYFIK